MQQKFLCDAMLAQLGKWLRAAGYDTLIADGFLTDRQLLDHAIMEDRYLITRDHKLVEFRQASGRVLLLKETGLCDWVAILNKTFAIDWLWQPFSRCLLCNTVLGSDPPDSIERLPEGAKIHAAQLKYCHQCDKLYWDGSHVQRMRAQLEAWERNSKEGSENN